MLMIQFTKHACKFLKRLPKKQALQFKAAIQKLQINPFPQDSKKLKGHFDYHRVSVGEYRIVYRVEKTVLLISLIGKRNDDEVYKKLKQIVQ